MDCAPFKKPSRKAGLFSYRSVIPPSPHETLLAQTSAGTPAALRAAIRGGASLAAVFLQKSPRAHSAAAPSPHETLLAQIFAGTPAARWAAMWGGVSLATSFFVSQKAHRALIPLLLLLPMKPCCAKFHGGPRRPGGRQNASGAPPAAAFCFVFRPLLDRGGRICYADSQIIRKESVTHKTMDDGDSTEGENPPLPHIQSFIGHSLCLRE